MLQGARLAHRKSEMNFTFGCGTWMTEPAAPSGTFDRGMGIGPKLQTQNQNPKT